jgi:GT2 family glycosyltransferase
MTPVAAPRDQAASSRDAAPRAQSASPTARILQALKSGELKKAWLLSDKLCRSHPYSVDALLLRSAVLAAMGDRPAADADVRKAGDIDPESSSLNRARLKSRQAAERIAAARTLLRKDDRQLRAEGIAALARDGVGCIGLFAASERRLSGYLRWNGDRTLDLHLKTDTGIRIIKVRSDATRKEAGFRQAAQVNIDVGDAASIAFLETPRVKAVFEPTSFHLPPVRKDAAVGGGERDDRLLIIVPVYNDREATRACLDSLFAAEPRPGAWKIVAVDDVSPDKALSEELDGLADSSRITLLRNTLNLGFAGSVNRGLTLRSPGQDALLLNADTIVPRGAIEAMARHARSHPDVATVTPLSNNGEDTSFPLRFRPNPMPAAAEVALLQNAATRANAGRTIELPNGIGFCLYVNGAAADRIGPLSCGFERGYYEDVEFCLRATALGYRNVCATDAYVGHHGERSFGASKRALVVRNHGRLVAAHPDYLAKADAFQRSDPLSEPVARIEEILVRQMSKLDLLLVPRNTPMVLRKAIVADLHPGEDRNLILACVGEVNGQLELRLTGVDNALPQNLTWSAAASRTGENKLLRKLTTLPVERIAALDVDHLPDFVRQYISGHERDLSLFTTEPRAQRRRTDSGRRREKRMTLQDRSRSLVMTRTNDPVAGAALPEIACTRPPQLEARCGILAVVSCSEIDLLRELSERLPRHSSWPSVVVAGRLSPSLEEILRDDVHVAGDIDDDELPAWLGRLGPRAVLFADRRWSCADPRAARWTELPTARFDAVKSEPCFASQDLYIPAEASPASAATVIAAWIADVAR